jgi:membrane-bound lytic murein transglycosylase B
MEEMRKNRSQVWRPARQVCALLCLAFVILLQPASAWGTRVGGEQESFERWLQGLRQEAQARGVTAATFDRAFAGVEPIARVVELDRRQPEFTLSFERYLQNAVTETRVARGRALLETHADLLARVQRKYGVQPRFLVAFWGLETNYGQTFGNFPAIAALATLAYDGRRGDFFRGELLSALDILESGDIEVARMEGSWAGALGHLQFMPTTFAVHAVDGDGDGRRDIWGSLPDVFASAANYLSALGWSDQETWGREVRLPSDFDWTLASIETMPETNKPLAAWSSIGVRRANGRPLPQAEMSGAIVLPAGHAGPAFLVYPNYRRILRWNRSIFYAIAVGHLADRLVGKPAMVTMAGSSDSRLKTAEIREMQALLGRLAFDAGKPDGKVGPMTRAAIRAYQQQAGLPADAYPSLALLQRLRADVTN